MNKRTLIALLVVGCGVGVAVTLANVDKWLFVLLDPGPFDPSGSPPPPDYSDPAAWAALPDTEDGADVFLAELPASNQANAAADVFYLHPTTWVGTQWNGPIDDSAVIEATHRGATLIQASAFNACCAVYAPRYRQANGRAFVDPDPNGERAIDIAYADVSAAFEIFLDRHNKGRPFILASHSQGTVLAARLLREEIRGKEPATRLIAAYLIGGPVSAATLGAGMEVCEFPTQTGCAIAWNARGPRYVSSQLEFRNPTAPPGADPLSDLICVNPLTWDSRRLAAPAAANAGALFFDADVPTVMPGFADAKCENGRLLVSEIGEPPRDLMSQILDWMMGPQNYHPIEYQLYYVNLRQNAVERVAAYAQQHLTQ